MRATMFRRTARRSTSRRWTRAVAMAVVVALSLLITTQDAVAEGVTLPAPSLSLSDLRHVAAWFTSPHWSNVPRQESGTADGSVHHVSAAATRANRGAGRAIGEGRGQLPAYVPYRPKFKAGPSARHTGFSARTSRRIASRSTADSTYYQNADGTITKKISEGVVNYRAGDSGWQPIDTRVRRGADGRWHETANSLAVDFAPTAGSSDLASFAVDSGHGVSYRLLGAKNVTAKVSGAVTTYASVLPDTDLTVQPIATGLKEAIVLHSASAANSWTFPLTLHGLRPVAAKGGAIDLVNTSGRTVEEIPPAYAYDANVSRVSGDPVTTHDVTYQLTTARGRPALAVTLDAAWLHSPKRVFPVTVDPSISDWSNTTYAESDNAGDHSEELSLKVGTYDSGVHEANSFLADWYRPFDNSKVTVTAASLDVFDTWASTCTAEPFNAALITSPWSPSAVTSYPGPSYGASIGSVTQSVPDACANTAGNRTVGDWVTVPLSTSAIQGWASGTTPDYGVALYASTANNNYWKQFGSVNDSGFEPTLNITYTGNVAPELISQYPSNNTSIETLTPELMSAGTDDGSPNASLQYDFKIYSASGSLVVDSGLVSSGDWTVPSGELAWNQTYYWASQAYDGALYSAVPAWWAFTVQVPQPVVTSSLSQNTGDHGLDPSIGNYTTSDTDASVSTVGPSLDVERDYNSRDPRITGAFGAGWSSVFDSRATEQDSPSGAVTSVVVTYPDGSEVGYGKNANGTFTPPEGRFATFKSVSGSGYTLTDKNDTVYTFAHSLGSGAWGITAITDADGRSVTFTWSAQTGGDITTMASAVSGRALHLSWSTPAGAGSPHVATVATDPVTTGGSALTWNYGYTGDQLTSVCSPTDASGHCAGYGYASGSQYQNEAMDLGPESFWPMAETSGTTAASAVLANEGSDDATYNGVTLGQPGPLAGSSATSAGFNGTSSYVELPTSLVSDASSLTVSLWFKTSTAPGVLFSYSDVSVTNPTTSGQYTPSLYIGSDGKLHAEFWYSGGIAPITTAAAVDDGHWHHVVLSGGGSSQTLYLDGSAVGSLSGAIGATSDFTTFLQSHDFVGAGFLGGGWPDEPHASTTSNTGYPSFFNGSIADAGVYSGPLTQSQVTALHQSGTQPASLLDQVTRPSGKAFASVSYDPVSAAVTGLTDENGGTWGIQAPTVSGSSQVYRSAVLGSAPAGYFRLGDPAGSAQAADEANSGAGTYSNVTLGAAGPFSDESAASFNGTSSSLLMPSADQIGAGPDTVEMWFKMPSGNTAGGVLMDEEKCALSADPVGCGGYNPMLYVGTDGKLHGKFWDGNGTTDQIVTSGTVNDGQWHLVMLSGSGSSQTMYLDGQSVGSTTGTMAATGLGYLYVGAGAAGGNWAAHPTNTLGYFPGSIAEVAFYRSALSAQDASDHWDAGQNSGGLSPVETVKVTDPNSKTLTYTYDPDNGDRELSETDGLGDKTSYGYDSGGFEHTVTDPDGDMTTTGHDVRGNTVSVTACQNQAANVCSTQYFTYYPDDTTAQLTTADARNDLLLTSRDGRSSGPTDNTYLTGYGYDTAGDQTTVTTPPVAGFPSGRITSTTYSDGTATYPAVGSGNVPKGLPVKTVSPGGATNTIAYYSNGDVASTTDELGLVTNYTYDKLGRVLSKTEVSDSYPNGLTTSYTYDGLDQVTQESDPGVTDRISGAVHTPVTNNVYDADGDLTSQSVSDATGGDAARTETSTYNQYDQLATSSDANAQAGAPNGATTTYTYDTSGNLATETDAQGNESEYAYDDDGHLLTTSLENYTGDPVNPSSATVLPESSRAYDPAGRLASIQDGMGNTTAYTYTDDGLLATTTRTDTHHQNPYVLQSDSYDAAGNVIQETADNGATTTGYQVDADSRTTSTTVDPNGVDRTTTVSYTPDDLVATSSETDAVGADRTVGYTYDAAGDTLSQTVYGDASGHPSGWWKMDQTSGATVPDSSGTGNTAQATGVTWGSGAATLSGTGGSGIATNGPVLNTTGSYSVSGWIQLPSTLPTHNVTLAAQTGTENSAFYLEYNYTHTSSPRWGLVSAESDTASPSYVGAYSSGAAVSGWTHLVGVFNASTGAMQLYVNGALAGSNTNTTPFAAGGPLTIGRSLTNGAVADPLSGSVSDIQVYPRALSSSEVSTLYSDGDAGGTVGSSNAQTTKWTYDKRGLPTSMTDPDQNQTTYDYDEAGNLAVTSAPAVEVETGGGTANLQHPVTTSGFNTFGESVEELDPDNAETTRTYDADGNMVTQTAPPYTPTGASSPLTATTTYTYDSLGNQTSVELPNGETTHSLYDQLGDIAQVTAPDGTTTHSTYDADGDALNTVDNTGATTAATYDDLGRQLTSSVLERYPTAQTLTTHNYYTASSTNPGGAQLSSTTSPAGVTTSYGYDNVGELTSQTDNADNTTRYAYDYLGDQTRVTAPDNTYAQTAYNTDQQPVSTTQYDASGNQLTQTSNTYDADGNVLSATDANQHTTTFTPDATGLVTQEVQPVSATHSITTSFGYDADGRQTRFKDGRGNSWIYGYTPWGDMASVTEPTTDAYTSAADSTTTYAYNKDDQLVSEVQPGGVSITMGYDQDGNLNAESGTGADAGTAARTFGYDGDGRMTSAATTAVGTAGQPGYQSATSENFGYDDRGDLTSATGSAGNSSFGYTPDGLMASRTDAAGTTTYGYDTDDRLQTLTDATTGTQSTYNYNQLSQLSSIQYGSNGQTRTFGYNTLHELTGDTLKQGASTVASMAYGYDNNGNLTSKTTTGVAGASANTYTYDWADRLTSWNNGTSTTAYAYDDSGNRVQVGSNVYTYDARDELTSDGQNSYTYTARGTLTGQSGPQGTLSYTADAYGQQITAGAQSYGLDALGRDVAVNTTNGQGAITQTSALQFSGQDNLVASDGSYTYAYDPSGSLVGINYAGAAQSSGTLALVDQHTDVVGDFTAGATTLTGSTTYDPLGNVTASATPDGQLGYQSGWTDAQTGKVNMAARWYNPATGEFLNKDTMQVNPMPNEASANPFAYVGDNPLGDIDPSGHCGWWSISCDVHAISHTVHSIVKRIKRTSIYRRAAAVVHHVVAEAHRAVHVFSNALNDAWHEVKVVYRRYVPASIRRRVSDVTHYVATEYKKAKTVAHRVLRAAAKVARKAYDVGVKAVKTVKTFVKHHAAAITSFVVSTAVFAGCEAVTAGVGSIGCAAAAGAAGNLVTQGFKCADQGGSACSVAAFGETALEGAATGALGGALGELGGKILSSLAPKALSAIGGLFTRSIADDAVDTAADDVSGTVASDAASDAESDASDGAAEASGGDGGRGDSGGGDEPEAGKNEESTSCPVQHSFVGATPVLMADGSSKPIDEIKAGDKVRNSVPGQAGTQDHTVQRVIVTHTDHDFVALGITKDKTPPKTAAETGRSGSLGRQVLRKAAMGLAASAAIITTALGLSHHSQPQLAADTVHSAPAAVSAPAGQRLTTTFHHAFYDETQASFVEADHLHVGDVLQTPTGTAHVTSIHLFHANTTTYDLTIGGLHTYYVLAGATPVLVHNCDEASDELLDIADANIGKTNTASEITSADGKVGYGVSGARAPSALTPQVRTAAEATGHHMGCSEIGALCELELQGADLAGTKATTVKVMGGSQEYGPEVHGELYPKCPSCRALFDFLDGKK